MWELVRLTRASNEGLGIPRGHLLSAVPTFPWGSTQQRGPDCLYSQLPQTYLQVGDTVPAARWITGVYTFISSLRLPSLLGWGWKTSEGKVVTSPPTLVYISDCIPEDLSCCCCWDKNQANREMHFVSALMFSTSEAVKIRKPGFSKGVGLGGGESPDGMEIVVHLSEILSCHKPLKAQYWVSPPPSFQIVYPVSPRDFLQL